MRASRPVAADQGMITSAPAARAFSISSLTLVLLGSINAEYTGLMPAASSNAAARLADDAP
ncbi:hypothetical protein D3C72_2030780 [compost metagenome]